ncbi:MAG: alpha/beta fold hydrolase [Anaerolineales bacterium]
MPYLVPGSEPFFLPGGTTGCLLLHGFTASPGEMRLFGKFLANNGYTVLSVRLAGHATHPNDLKHTRWTDWLDNVEDGLALLSRLCAKRVLIGQSLGGVIALTAAARYDDTAVVALSTPYGKPPKSRWNERLQLCIHPIINKGVRRFPRHHPLYHRRELYYPTYPEFPAQILSQLNQLIETMAQILEQVHVPTFLVHSRDDQAVPFDRMQSIYDHLGSPKKEMVAFDGMDHSLVMDPNRQVVFNAVQEFLARVVDSNPGT